MRTTVRIDDDLMAELRARAHADNVPLARMLNRTLRDGLAYPSKQEPNRRPFKQKTFRMGTLRVGIDKALALAAALEDEEYLRKMTLRDNDQRWRQAP